MYGFFDLPRNAPAFRINKALLIAAKAVVRFPTVFCNFILITILIPDKLLCSSERDFKNRLDSQMQTASQWLQSILQTILFLFSIATQSLVVQRILRKVFSVQKVDLILWDLSLCSSLSLVPSLYGKFILILISSVAFVCWCYWGKL